MDTREVVARFESERQALALMDHPAIAKVFDAGSTAEGRPYFVMEYVAGVPITEYCDRHKLTLREQTGAVCARMRRGAARAPEGDHPSRSEAFEHSGERGGRQAPAEDHRFRRGEGDGPAADGRDDADAAGNGDRHAGVYEPGAGGFRGRGHRYAQRTSIRWG